MEKSKINNSFTIRFLSALIAVILMGFLIFYFGDTGFHGIILFAVIVGGWELSEILFRHDPSLKHKSLFIVALLSIFIGSSYWPEFMGLIFVLVSILFCIFSLLVNATFKDLSDLTFFQSKSVLGFFYMGLLPSVVDQLLQKNNGLLWVLSLLAVVFAGDIFAYGFGRFFGKTQLMPNVSPKKTVEGAIGGLLGSFLFGIICATTLLDLPLWHFGGLALIAGCAAQIGDLFESALKRVANVKDSGRIMPGHGGILDRIDGVLFASPIFLFGAIIFDKIPR